MNLQEKPISEIEKELYEVLADKTLSMGCKIITGNSFPITHEERIIRGERIEDGRKYEGHTGKWIVFSENPKMSASIYKIIGHEPTLNDVLLKLSRENLIMNTYPAIDNEEILCVRYKSDVGWGRVIHYDLTKSFDHKDNEGMRRKLHDLICKK